MKEKAAFEAALTTNPRDYTLRLIYADWLEDHDEPEEADRQRAYEGAVEWMEAFASDLGGNCVNYDETYQRVNGRWQEVEEQVWKPITFEQVIQAGHDAVKDPDDYFVQLGTEHARSVMHKDEMRAMFWRNWSILTGVTVGDEQKEHTVFSCSC